MIEYSEVSKSTIMAADPSYSLFFSDPDCRFDRGGLMEELQLFAPQPDGGMPYIFCGDRSTTAAIWGGAVARGLVGTSALPNVADDYQRFVDQDYRRVRETGEISAARVVLDLELDKPVRISFWRLVFPFSTGQGTAVGTLTRFVEGGRPETFAIAETRS